jgi:hypothetical protein
MMRARIALAMVIVAGGFFAIAGPAQAVAVSVVELLEDAEAFAGQEVTVVGELVGDYGFRRDGSMWTQLNGDSYSIRPIVDGGPLRGSNLGIGIRMPADIGRRLDPPGRYRRLGPVVQVTGIWKYHDPERQGETYLDVRSVVLQGPGRQLSEGPNWTSYGVGFAFFVIAGVIGFAYKRERDSID